MTSENKVINLSPEDAHKLVESKPSAILIDVRSSMEYLFVGHALGSIHVAWIDEPDWIINPHFVTQVRQVMLGGVVHLNTIGGAPVVLICRSGKRSLEAGNLLVSNGFTDVYNVIDGFEGELDEHHHRSSTGGWRYLGLPWEQC